MSAPVSTLATPPTHLSWSQCSTLSPPSPYACERKWALQRLAGLPYPPSRAMRVGSLFDAAVSTLFYPRAEAAGDLAVPLDLATAQTRLMLESGQLLDDAEDPGELASVLGLLPLSLDAYAALHAGTPVAAVQQPVTWYHDGVRVEGFIDRVDVGRTITDLKVTGSAPRGKPGAWTDERLLPGGPWTLQLTFYACALAAEAADAGVAYEWPVPAAVDVVTVRSGQVKPRIDILPFWLTWEDALTVQRMVTDSRRRADRGVYPPRPGAGCDRCPYTTVCQAMGELVEPDFGALWARLS